MAKRITAQGLFDFVYRFIVRQGRMSYDDAGSCRYRQRVDGKVLACAAGCLLSDEEAALVNEGHSWPSIFDQFPRFASHYSLIRELQTVHDGASRQRNSSAQVERFKDDCADLARRHGLTVPEA